VKLLDTAALRVEISHLERDCREIMMKMGRVGVTDELLAAYTKLDSRIILKRMELVQDLRHILADRSTSL